MDSNSNNKTAPINQHEQTIKNIKQLQDTEKNLFNQLQNSMSNGEELHYQDSIINNINQISTTRINLFKMLQDIYKVTSNGVTDAKNDLDTQMKMIEMTENDINVIKKQINDVKKTKNHNLRTVEFNDYYGSQVMGQIKIVKLILYFCIPLFILLILNKLRFLPYGMYISLTILIVITGILYVIFKMYDLNSRNNMIFSEYDMGQEKQLHLSEPTYRNNGLNGLNDSLDLGGCIGAECCSAGMKYDNTNHKCIENLNKTSNIKDSVKLNGNKIQPHHTNVENFQTV